MAEAKAQAMDQAMAKGQAQGPGKAKDQAMNKGEPNGAEKSIRRFRQPDRSDRKKNHRGLSFFRNNTILPPKDPHMIRPSFISDYNSVIKSVSQHMLLSDNIKNFSLNIELHSEISCSVSKSSNNLFIAFSLIKNEYSYNINKGSPYT